MKLSPHFVTLYKKSQQNQEAKLEADRPETKKGLKAQFKHHALSAFLLTYIGFFGQSSYADNKKPR